MFQLIFCPLVFVLLKINLSEVLFLLEIITNLKIRLYFLFFLHFAVIVFTFTEIYEFRMPRITLGECGVGETV